MQIELEEAVALLVERSEDATYKADAEGYRAAAVDLIIAFASGKQTSQEEELRQIKIDLEDMADSAKLTGSVYLETCLKNAVEYVYRAEEATRAKAAQDLVTASL